jgi:tRNA uridine 5-carbamoylmethylation protein Kti12
MGTDTLIPNHYWLIGLPGTGKTTYRQELLRLSPLAHVFSTDDIIDEHAERLGFPYDATLFQMLDQDNVYKEAVRRMGEALKADPLRDLIVDRTNLTDKSRHRMDYEIANMLGCHAALQARQIAIVFSIPRDVLDRRLEKRRRSTGKDIPRAVIEYMTQSYEPPIGSEYDEIRIVNEYGDTVFVDPWP